MRNPEGYETRQGFSSLIYSSWGQNTFKYTQLLHLSVPTALQREGRGGGKPLFAGKKGSQILSLLASVTSVFGAGFFSTKATQSGELTAILVVFPVPPSLL